MQEKTNNEKQIVDDKENKEKKDEPKNIEHGGRGGLDPVRFGDYEIAGKCVDF